MVASSSSRMGYVRVLAQVCVLTSLLLSAGGCGKNDTHPLMGAWVADSAQHQESMFYKKAPPAQKQAIDAEMEGVELRMIFEEDALIMRSTKNGESEDFRVEYTLTLARDGYVVKTRGPEGEAQQFTVTLEGESMVLEKSPGDRRVFHR